MSEHNQTGSSRDSPATADETTPADDLPATQPPGAPIDNDPTIEELDISDWSSPRSAPKLGRPRRIEDTRATLAYCLLGLLTIVLVGLMGLLACGAIPASSFAEVAGVMVSPLVGLVGAVAGYYYGKSDR